jgi:hypothetical protein
MDNERENQSNKEQREQYQLNRAKAYLDNHKSKDGAEPNLECCIISDLLRIIKNK